MFRISLTFFTDYVFPALDILRISLQSRDVCRLFCSRPDFVDLLCQHADQGNPQTCRMLAMRTFTNLFRHSEGVELSVRQIDAILQAAISCKDLNSKGGQVAVASLILNYCIKLCGVDDLESKSKCLQAVGEVLSTNLDPEAAYRLLVAIGTLAAGDDGCKALAHSIDLPAVVSKFHTSDSSKIAECSKLLFHTLSS